MSATLREGDCRGIRGLRHGHSNGNPLACWRALPRWFRWHASVRTLAAVATEFDSECSCELWIPAWFAPAPAEAARSARMPRSFVLLRPGWPDLDRNCRCRA